ncbi:hypothetical protein VTL71DRAFT_8459 [Oculimacula yallundae]|uniref:Clr5 domain-containing protein n=1 Tax=Oculimacula yallundae TaxID=86028 RepID=A0ABR4CXN5_9HELO
MNPPDASALPAMNPSQIPRQTQRHGKEEWEAHRERIVGLYHLPGIKLSTIKDMLGQEHGFVVTERQLKSKIDGWKIAKNVQSFEMGYIVQKKHQRALARKPTNFRVRGQPVPPEKIVRWQKRSGYLIEDNMFSVMSPPSDVSYSPASTNVLSPRMTETMIISSPNQNHKNMDWVANEDTTLQSPPDYQVMDAPLDNSARMDLDKILASYTNVFEGQSPAPFTPRPSPKLSPVTLSSQELSGLVTEHSFRHQVSDVSMQALSVSRATAAPTHVNLAPPTFANSGSLNYNVRDDASASEPKETRYLGREELELRYRLSELDSRYGSNHPATLDTLERLACVLHDQGRLRSAESYFKKLSEVCRSNFGEDDLRTIEIFLGLIKVYVSQNNLTLAERLCRRLYVKAPTLFPADHLINLKVKWQWGSCLYVLGRFDEAEQVLCEVIRLGGPILLPDDTLLIEPMYLLALVLDHRGNYVEAERMIIAILEATDIEMDSNNASASPYLSFLGAIYTGQERYQESEELLRKVFANQAKVLGKEHRDTLATQRFLGETLARQQRYKESEEVLQDALLKLDISLGRKHSDGLKCRVSLAQVMNWQRKYDQAEVLLRETVELAIEALGPEHNTTCHALFDLGASNEGQGRLEEALTVSRRAFEGSARMLGKDHRITVYYKNRVKHLEELILVERVAWD